MTDLRTAAQQALEDLKDLHANHNITYAGTIAALEAALAQQQANPPGCDHCNHPLYAATRCRVCGRVTEQAEPVQEPAIPKRGKYRTLDENTIKMARQAWGEDHEIFWFDDNGIERFANLVRAAKQDRCCRIIFGMAGSDNVAQRTVDAIRNDT